MLNRQLSNLLVSKKVDNVAQSFSRDSQFKSHVFLFDSMIFLNCFFNVFMMRVILLQSLASPTLLCHTNLLS